MLSPSRFISSACSMAWSRISLRHRVLAADVDPALVRADGVTRQRHTFQNGVGIALEDQPVLECAGLRFIGVADDVLRLLLGRCATNDHLSPVGKPAPPRPCKLESLTSCKTSAGVISVRACAQREVPILRDVLFDAVGIDAAGAPEHDALLTVERASPPAQWPRYPRSSTSTGACRCSTTRPL